MGLDTTVGNATLAAGINNANVVLTKTGVNTLTIDPSVTNNVKTAVQTGTLALTNRNNLFAGNTVDWTAANFGVVINAALAINVGGAGEFTSADITTLTSQGTATGGFMNGSTLAVDTTNAGGNFSHNAVIANPNAGANALDLTKLGSGTLTLTKANTHTGTTTLVSGELYLLNGNALQNSTYINTGGTLTLSSIDETATPITAFKFGALSGSTSINMLNDAAGTVNIILGDRSATYSGTISGSGNLIHSGTGA